MAIDKSNLMEKPWERWNVSQKEFEEFYSNMMARETNVPKVGDPAPHFEAERLDAKGKRTGENFKFGGPGPRPVAFVFGSYT